MRIASTIKYYEGSKVVGNEPGYNLNCCGTQETS